MSVSGGSSRSLLRSLAPPHRAAPATQREVAFGFVQHFTRFAEGTCGCTATSNRAHLRRAVFHATSGLPLEPFVERRLGGDVGPLMALARMECPVAIPSEDMHRVKVMESAPRRIIFAAKNLRKHLSLAEAQTCRGCQKRGRCRFFKKPLEETYPAAELGHVGRVVFGIAQYCRAFLQHPEEYPLAISETDFKAARFVMDAMSAHLTDVGQGVPYEELPLADSETATAIHLAHARKKLERQQQKDEEKALQMPSWMRQTLQPVSSKGMTRWQRTILRDTESLNVQQQSREQDMQDELQWIEESNTPGLPLPDILEIGVDTNKKVRQFDLSLAGPVTEVDGLDDLPIVKRFETLKSGPVERALKQQYDSLRGSLVGGVYHSKAERLGHRIDLDEVAGPEALALDDASEDSAANSQHGGYSIVDLLSKDTFSNVPQEAQRFVSLAPTALDGVHQYQVQPKRNLVDPRVLDELWKRAPQSADELPFLSRVPFDAGLGRSGGSRPPGALPQGKLLQAPEELRPPPLRQNERTSDSTGGHGLIELDNGAGRRSRADEQLAALALAGAEASVPASPPRQAFDRTSPTFEDSEDLMYAAWRSRSGKPIGVLEPSVDFGELGDPDRLDATRRRIPAEATVPDFRQAEALPQDEAFVKAFRKPLLGPAGEQAGALDPLGGEIPGVDIEAVRQRAVELESGQPQDGIVVPQASLAEDQGFIFGGSIKFPKLPEPQRMPTPSRKRMQSAPGGIVKATPREGRLRQARLGDMAELMRPGTVGDPNEPGESEVEGQHGLSWPPEASPKQESAAMALQRLMHNQTKAASAKQFPPGKGPGIASRPWARMKQRRRSSPADLAGHGTQPWRHR